MYTLPENLTIRNVEPVQEELIHFLNRKLVTNDKKKKEAVLDFLHLKDLDTAGLQLLLTAAINFHQKNCSLKIINVQVPIQELLKLSGVGEVLIQG